MSKQEQIQHLTSLLSSTEIIKPSDPSYKDESITWATQRYLRPQLVIRPTSLESLSKAVKYLAESSLDFQIRNSGVGNGSAKDVVLSMRAFNEVTFDREKEVVYLGAGALWAEYYEKMEQDAPDYTVVAARTPFIGVGGSILAGGFSWLSADYGCISDPDNMLDAQIVKLDGNVIWASEEPDLLWGLRGAQLGLGVVTQFKLRAYQYPQKIFGGHVLIPKGYEHEIARGIVALDKGPYIPKVSMFMYTLNGILAQALGGKSDGDTLVVNVFDGNGEEHARKLFSWVFEIPGVVDHCRVMNLHGFAKNQAAAVVAKGTKKGWFNTVATEKITEDNIMKSLEWWDKVRSAGGSVAETAYLLLELFCMPGSKIPAPDSAWPRRNNIRHTVLLGTECAPDAPAEESDVAYRLARDGPKEIMGERYDEGSILPNAMEDFHNVKAVYGDNWPKIVATKKKYDPNNRLRGTPNVFAH